MIFDVLAQQLDLLPRRSRDKIVGDNIHCNLERLFFDVLRHSQGTEQTRYARKWNSISSGATEAGGTQSPPLVSKFPQSHALTATEKNNLHPRIVKHRSGT